MTQLQKQQAKRIMIFGTSYFDSLESIYRFYGNEKFNIDAINKKISTGECHIGKPKINNRQKLTLENGRYIIHEVIINLNEVLK